ncbi:hypothetical protein PM082_023196 [Marasmius tenuissimus]|nr:hypothetical protein PM082_023196 [Marasmius tenuissimus]
MKFTIGILTIVIQIASIHSVAVSSADATAQECGSLGVLNVDLNNLPEGMTPSDVRKCADHPIGSKPRQNAQSESVAPMDRPKSELTDRSDIIEGGAAQVCDVFDPYGCSSGYCWKACGALGSGDWCWTAGGDGSGPWMTCSKSSDCDRNAACGKGDNCSTCGCRCH